MRKLIAGIMVVVLCVSMCACKKSEAMKAAEEAVKAIGTVTLDSLESIEAAETAVSALSAEEKEKFKYSEELQDAKTQYDKLKTEKDMKDISAKIDTITDVTLENGKLITDIETEFNNLSDETKEKVANKQKLLDATKKLKEIRAAEKERIISEKTPLFIVTHDKVYNTTYYFPNVRPEYNNERTYVLPNIYQEGNTVSINMRYNYVSDDWLFWTELTILIDGKKYYKQFSYNDITRDNAYGDIIEVFDEDASDEANLQMLREIAESEETIVRFEGEDYWDDFVIGNADKQAIKDTLALYEALLW